MSAVGRGEVLLRSVLAAIVILLCLGSLSGQSFVDAAGGHFNETGPSDDWLHSLDFETYRLEAQRRFSALGPEGVERLVRENFRFVYLQRMRRDFFLRYPRPEWAMERLTAVLKLHRELQQSIDSTRGIASSEGVSRRRVREAVHHIGRLAGDLRRTFRTSFEERKGISFRYQIPQSVPRDQLLVHFTLQASRISTLLDAYLDDYFFKDEPGLVHFSQLEGHSLHVLARSLGKLCADTERRLKDAF